jgi:hypothetical protein
MVQFQGISFILQETTCDNKLEANANDKDSRPELCSGNQQDQQKSVKKGPWAK